MLHTTRSVLFAAAIAAAPFVPTATVAAEEVPTLTLTAEGSVAATPDTAVVSLGVVEQAPTAGEALTANNAAMASLMDELKAAGIADRDIRTSNFSIDPVMVYPNEGEDRSPKLVGYRVSNQVTVKIRGIGKTGTILDSVVRLGANQVDGISFTVEDPSALLDTARAEAMKLARARAEVYAQAGGFGLGRLVSVRENDRGGFEPRIAMAPMMKAEADSVPIAVGEQELTVSVSVSYEIREPAQP